MRDSKRACCQHFCCVAGLNARGNIKTVTASEVVFSVRADEQGGKRIRYCGVLVSACKTDKLKQARLALQMPQPNPQAVESAQAFMARVARIETMQSPCCKG